MGNHLIISLIAFWKCIKHPPKKPKLDKKVEQWIKEHRHEEKSNNIVN
jgi:cupin superfamily acireductone dioxygenase involved in methionine salvage